MLSIITISHARPKCFARLEHMLARRTYRKAWQWIVVCSGTKHLYSFTQPNQKVIFRENDYSLKVGPMVHPICQQYLAAIPHVEGDSAIIMEDDDLFMPEFLTYIDSHLGKDGWDMVGLAPNYYYNFSSNKFILLPNYKHCSLSGMGFRTRLVLSLFQEICEEGNPFIDQQLWLRYGGSKALLPNRRPGPECLPLVVGGKGLEAPGVGLGHNLSGPGWLDDVDGEMKEAWLGDLLPLYAN